MDLTRRDKTRQDAISLRVVIGCRERWLEVVVRWVGSDVVEGSCEINEVGRGGGWECDGEVFILCYSSYRYYYLCSILCDDRRAPQPSKISIS